MEPTLSRVRFNTGVRLEFAQIQKLTGYLSGDDTCPPVSPTASGAMKKIDKNTIFFTKYHLQAVDSTNPVKAYYFKRGTIFPDYIYTVYKKTPQQTYYRYLCTLSSDETADFRDFNIRNKESYQYMVVVQRQQPDGSISYSIYETRDYEGNSIYIPTNWNRWSITNIVETDDEKIYTQSGDVWLLGMNIESEQITQNLGATSRDSLGQYPRIARNQKNFMSSNYSGLLGDVEQYFDIGLNGKVDPTSIESYYSERSFNRAMLWGTKVFINNKFSHQLDKFRAWQKFCADGELKLLKDIRGNSWIVQITDNPVRRLNTKGVEAHTNITFNWQEVMNIDDISIIAEGADID